MSAERELPIRQRLAAWVEHLSHVLPAQAPIRDFVHHNTLHGFQHLPFDQALVAAQQLTGASVYWPESRFRECFAAGRITRDDLLAAVDAAAIDDLDQPLLAGVTQRDVLLASLLLGTEVPAASRLAWLSCERGLADDPVFARCRALTAASAAEAGVADWRAQASARWAALCQRVGRDLTWSGLLEHLSGEDLGERGRSIVQRHLAAHLDLGVAAWRNPQQHLGFFAAWRACAGLDLQWALDELPSGHDEIVHLPADPLDVLADELARLQLDEGLWYDYLAQLSLALPGWSGMVLWRERHPACGEATPVAMLDYLAVRVLLERLLAEELLARLTGEATSFAGLPAYYEAHLAEFFVRDALRRQALPEDLQQRAADCLNAGLRTAPAAWESLAAAIAAPPDQGAAEARAWQLAGLVRQLGLSATDLAGFGAAEAEVLLNATDRLTSAQRGQVWLLAYERHYREQLFAALTANHRRPKRLPLPSAQVVMCMDDREEGTRRHLEEIAPSVVTYGAAGFFGVAMYWQGMDDVQKTALCPIVVEPRHLVRESPAPDAAEAFAGHVQRRERRLRWRERLYQSTRRRALGGPLLTALAGAPALLALTATMLAPGWFGSMLQRWRQQHEGSVTSQLNLNAETAVPPPALQQGFSEPEQVDRVEAFLRMIGLTENFAPLVLMFGHGSASQNNPHLSAYDCGACSGRHGGPNARVFAALANRPAVRAGLAERGLHIPASTWFVAAEHNTCDDGIDWYDLAQVPAQWQAALDTLVSQLSEACRAHAAERCRRLASAPPRLAPWPARHHVIGRRHDISQARPELGHATNAAALIGRRQMSRGLFLDRRVFLISYEPTGDDDGAIVESILLAAGPVGAGIALEYYFSSVDNERFGCGSKITHNITGLFGVMEGADSDLRTGLPWQMVEIHEPMRLLVVVEQTPAVLSAILARQPALQELIDKAWIVLAAQNPLTAAIEHYCPRRGWLPWSGPAVLPQVARSVDWFAGQSEALAPALLLGAAA